MATNSLFPKKLNYQTCQTKIVKKVVLYTIFLNTDLAFPTNN
jgi:hypothetical protein